MGIQTVPRFAIVAANVKFDDVVQSTSVRSSAARCWIALIGSIRRGTGELGQLISLIGESQLERGPEAPQCESLQKVAAEPPPSPRVPSA